MTTANEIMALDIATKTGFSTSTASGVWNFTPKKDESKGMRLIRFRSKVMEMVKLHGIKMVVFEAAVAYGKHPNFVGVEMIGVLKITLEELGVEYMAHQPSAIKKWATGNGNAGKPLMVKTAQTRWGMEGKDDNQADAIAIFHFTCSELGLTPNESII
jgi:Holliday junction resolvasome RuvABC endonuclease subunit